MLVYFIGQEKYLTGENMEKLVQVARLFDTYGSLLNEKQKDVINCYYNEDLSLRKKKDKLRDDLFSLRELIESSNKSCAIDMIDEMINKI